MKRPSSILIFFIVIALTGIATCITCDKEPCKSVAKNWKKEVSRDLPELKGAIEEMRSHDSFFRKKKDLARYDFIALDSDRIENACRAQFPKLKRWMTNSEEYRYMSYSGDFIRANYKSCHYTSGIFPRSGFYYSYLYYSPGGFHLIEKSVNSSMIDTFSLGDHWYYVLTDCDGCGD